MAKSEFLGRHYQCDACGEEVEGRSDHNELFKGWSEIQKLDIFYGHPQCKVLCPMCSELYDLTLAENFSRPDPANPPIVPSVNPARIKDVCRRCGKDTGGKRIKRAGPTTGEWEGVPLCAICRIELNNAHAANSKEERNVGDLLKEMLASDAADATPLQLPCDSM